MHHRREDHAKNIIRIVKARLAQTEGGPLEGQRFRLVFEGRDLPAAELVGSAKLAKGSLVMAVLLRADIGELECPEAGARVHFTGGLVLDHFVTSYCSEPYVEDSYSEYVGVGRFPDNSKAFPKAIAASFDGVIVDAGTRVTIYSEANFQGSVLWDRVGPAIVVNNAHTGLSFKDNSGDTSTYREKLLRQWKEPLNIVFPPEVREFSETNMYSWHTGSLVITGGQEIPLGCMRLADYASASKRDLDRAAEQEE